MILAGLSSIVLIEIYTSVMQRQYQDTDNNIGKGFAVLGIYLFVVAYCKQQPQSPGARVALTNNSDSMLNSTTWLYGAEVLPIALRSKVMGLAAASHFIVNVGSESLFPPEWPWTRYSDTQQSRKPGPPHLPRSNRTTTTCLWPVLFFS